MNDHQDIMKRYDIRDQYELHNLLRKIVPEGSYHNFRCGRTPMITFGEFDRDRAIEDLLIENAPIELNDFADIINEEYGYDQATIIGTYLRGVSKYYSHGVYTVDHKEMTPENMTRLSNELSDDFYYIDEVRKIYKRIAPNADPEEINSFNLKTMGFSVLSKYVLHNFPSLDAYFLFLSLNLSIHASQKSGSFIFSRISFLILIICFLFSVGKDQLKTIVFNNVMMKALPDQRKFIRDIKGLVKNNTYRDYFDDQKILADELRDEYDQVGLTNISWEPETTKLQRK